MKRYLQNLQTARNASKFNMIYEAIMQDLDIYKQVPANTAKLAANKSLTLIVEEINKPQYIICESGRELLLEEAIFMSDEYLISEGIFDKVSEKIQQLIEYIKAGIKKVLSKSSDVIKAFCEKVKENKVVAAIRKKLGLDEKLKAENFKKFVKVKAAGKEVAAEAVYSFLNDEHIITEATKLSKKEEAITDPKELEALIKKWEDAVTGKTPINNAKTGKPLTKGYCQDKLRLLKKKMASLKNDGESKTETKADDKTSKNISVKGEKNSDLKVNKDKPIGDIHFSVDGISNYIKSVKESSTSEETINAATQTSAVAVGGDKVANVITGDSAPPEESSEKPKKKGLLGKISAAADKVGNKMKDKIKSVASKAKAWFNAQNKWVKILICAIIAVLALLAIYWLITTVVFPIIYGIMNGGVINAATGIFRLYASGKTFVATYKQGKKSWQTGEGWGKTFLLLGASILAAINLGQMASQGSEMMAADKAKETTSTASSVKDVKGGGNNTEAQNADNNIKKAMPNNVGEIASEFYNDSFNSELFKKMGGDYLDMQLLAEAGFHTNFNSGDFADVMSKADYKKFFNAYKAIKQHAPTEGVFAGTMYHTWQSAYKAAVASGTLDKCKAVFDLVKNQN